MLQSGWKRVYGPLVQLTVRDPVEFHVIPGTGLVIWRAPRLAWKMKRSISWKCGRKYTRCKEGNGKEGNKSRGFHRDKGQSRGMIDLDRHPLDAK